MHPQQHELLRCFELVWLCHQKTLEDVAEVPDVELIVEVCRCLPEIRSNLREHIGYHWLPFPFSSFDMVDSPNMYRDQNPASDRRDELRLQQVFFVMPPNGG